MRNSGEITAYPEIICEWETNHPNLLASEEINVLFEIENRFHGVCIDGVDDSTAKMPSEWRECAVEKSVPDRERSIRAIAPCFEDLLVSKLHRLSAKDEEFIRAYHLMQPLEVELIKARFSSTSPDPSFAKRAGQFLDIL